MYQMHSVFPLESDRNSMNFLTSCSYQNCRFRRCITINQSLYCAKNILPLDIFAFIPHTCLFNKKESKEFVFFLFTGDCFDARIQSKQSWAHCFSIWILLAIAKTILRNWLDSRRNLSRCKSQISLYFVICKRIYHVTRLICFRFFMSSF